MHGALRRRKWYTAGGGANEREPLDGGLAVGALQEPSVTLPAACECSLRRSCHDKVVSPGPGKSHAIIANLDSTVELTELANARQGSFL